MRDGEFKDRQWSAKSVLILILGLAACSSGSQSEQSTDSETETGTGSDTATETEHDTDSDTQEPGGLGEPCWNDYFPSWHPNAGLPDCEDDYDCIGDEDEAWCTIKCPESIETGTYNTENNGLEEYCCGELIDPCDPNRYWLPKTMNFNCIPKTTPLAQQCDLETTWTGENALCEPVCDGQKTIHPTVCAQYQDEKKNKSTFCTFTCNLANGDADCIVYPAFSSGCCGKIMGGNFCLIEELCK